MTNSAPKKTTGKHLNLLFFGDIVGKPGRNAVTHYLRQLSHEDSADIVIANAENTTHGFGLSEKHYNELTAAGIDILTGGNHTWDRREIVNYIGNAQQMVRPGNLPADAPGVGHKVFEFGPYKLGVVNIMGQAFMGNYDSPFDYLKTAVKNLQQETSMIFVDMHAEATAEKICCGYFASQLGVSAMVGTHTHVQTADERILDDRMGYITDAGFNGPYHSVIGMEVASALARQQSALPIRLEVAESNEVQINGVRFKINTETGHCIGIERINDRMNLSEHGYS